MKKWGKCIWCEDEFWREPLEYETSESDRFKFCKTSHRQRYWEARLDMPLTQALMTARNRWMSMREDARSRPEIRGTEGANPVLATYDFVLQDLEKLLIDQDLQELLPTHPEVLEARA